MNFKTFAQRAFKTKYFFGSNEQKPPKIQYLNPQLTNPDAFQDPFTNDRTDKEFRYLLIGSLIFLTSVDLIEQGLAILYYSCQLKEYFEKK